MGRDLAEPVFAASKARLEKQVADFDVKWQAEYLDDNGNILSEKRLTGYFADDISSWTATDGKIAPLVDEDAIVGEGSEDSPYIIKNLKGWVWFVYKTGFPTEEKIYTYAKLDADIDFGGLCYDITFSDDGNLLTDGFVGVLDGQGHSLYNYIMYGVGIFTSVGNITFPMAMSGEYTPMPFEDSVIRNLSLQGEGANNPNVGGGLAIAALSSFVTYENLTYQYDVCAGEMALYFMYIVDSSRFVNCNLSLTGCNTMSALGMAAMDGSSEGLGIYPIEVIDCTSSVEVYGGIAVPYFMSAYGMKIKMSNSLAKGMIYKTSGGEGSYAGGFLGWDMGGCDIQITSCKNYTTFAAMSETGGIVGNVYRGEKSRLEVVNCENFGDIYCIDNNRANDAYGGIVGAIEDYAYALISDCKNFGNIYSGGYQAGIVGEVDNCDNVNIINCLNAGTLAYPVIITNGIGQSISSGIAILRSGSISIKNCVNTGSLIRYSQKEEEALGYRYNAGSHSFLSMAAGILVAGNLDVPDDVIGNIYVEGCTVACRIDRHTSVAGLVNHVGNISLDENNEKRTVISIRDCSLLLNCDYDKTDFLSYCMCITTIVAVNDNQASKLASLEMVNIYADIFSTSNFLAFGAYTCENTVLESIQVNLHVDYSDFAVQSIGADVNISEIARMCYTSIFSNSATNVRVNNFNFKAEVILIPEMEMYDTFEINEEVVGTLRNLNATNCAVEMNVIKTENDPPEDHMTFKGIVHNSETLPMFSSSEWGWSENLNEGLPVLKKFFWQEGLMSGEEAATKFESAGFIRYEKTA